MVQTTVYKTNKLQGCIVQHRDCNIDNIFIMIIGGLFDSWVGKCPWRRDRPPIPLYLVAQTVKNLPAMQETWVRSLGWKDLLEKGTATHSSMLVWRIPMDRGAWRATVHGVAKRLTRLSD